MKYKYTILLLLFFFLISTHHVFAACSSPTTIGGRPSCVTTGHPNTCWVGGTLVQCCDLASECPTGATTPPAPGAPSIWCNGQEGIVDTAIGCLNASDPKAFLGQILGWASGIGAGIAFVMIAIAGFTISTSAGDVKKVKQGQELLFASIAGLVLIVLAIVILNFIGIEVLNLGGLGFGA